MKQKGKIKLETSKPRVGINGYGPSPVGEAVRALARQAARNYKPAPKEEQSKEAPAAMGVPVSSGRVFYGRKKTEGHGVAYVSHGAVCGQRQLIKQLRREKQGLPF